MTGPTSPGQRRAVLRRARRIAAGTSAGAAVLLTGTIAVVHATPTGPDRSGGTAVRYDRGEIEDDEYGPAVLVAPRSQEPQQQSPQAVPQPRTRSRGS